MKKRTLKKWNKRNRYIIKGEVAVGFNVVPTLQKSKWKFIAVSDVTKIKIPNGTIRYNPISQSMEYSSGGVWITCS